MEDRRAVVVRLSDADLKALRPLASAAGLKLDALMLAAALRFTTVDPEFKTRKGRQVSWGPPPARFAAAEMVDIDLSNAQHVAVERAAAAVYFERDGDTVAVSPAQFISGAALRLLQRAKPGQLKADLIPFLGPELPPVVSIEETIVPARSARAPAAPSLLDSDDETVRPAVRSFFSAEEIDGAKEAPKRAAAVTAPPIRARRLDDDEAEADDDARERPSRSDDGAQERKRRAADDERDARRSRRRDRDADDRDEEDDDEQHPPPMELPDPPASSGFDLRIGLVIGGLLLLAVIAAGVWVKTHGTPPKPPPDDAPVVDPEAPADDDSLTRAPDEPESFPEVIEPPRLPPPPDEPEPAADASPEVVAASKALKELTQRFHTEGNPEADIDGLLRTVYGRPRVDADGHIVQSDFPALTELNAKLPPDQRYDLAIAAAVESAKHVYKVPPALVKAIIRRESNFKPTARSHVGAVGLMQVMPFNAARVGMVPADLEVPEKNILAGTRLMAVLLRYYDGDITQALVAYNAKPRSLFAKIPRNSETPGYVAAVMYYLKQYSDSAALKPTPR